MNLFSPAQIAENYVSIGKSKVNTAIPKMFLLAVMAGVFIALGGVAATTAAVGVQPAAIGKLLGACIFPGGLTMVLLAGSELFTGNCLLTVPLLSGEVTLPGVLRNWIVVYLGNFAGGLLVAAGSRIFASAPPVWKWHGGIRDFHSGRKMHDELFRRAHPGSFL